MPQKRVITLGWGQLHNEEIRHFYSSDIIEIIQFKGDEKRKM
jgi:hypothetical protein